MKQSSQEIKRRFKKALIGLALFGTMHTTATAKQPANKDAFPENVEYKTDNAGARARFMPEELVDAAVKANLSQEQATAFIKGYTERVDKNGFISAEDMFGALKGANLPYEQMSTFSEHLIKGNKVATLDKSVASDLIYSLQDNGKLSRLEVRSNGKSCDEQSLLVVIEAQSRQKGLPYDRMESKIDASQLMDKYMLSEILQQKQQKGEKLSIGEQNYLKIFTQELKDNGLQSTKKGLEMTKEASVKPLKNTKEMREDFQKFRAKEYRDFSRR